MPRFIQAAPYRGAETLRAADDTTIMLPLWEFSPEAREAVLHERRRRNILQEDPEPVGDSEYS